MIRTNMTTKSKTITFHNDAGEYSGQSFQYVQNDAEAWVIIDWLNGGQSTPGIIGSFTVNKEEYDTKFLNRRLSATLKEYVKEKVIQKLNIHLNEFRYRYENTEEVGIPYLQKPTKDELDLFIRETILSTTGVKEIKKFASRTASGDGNEYGKNKVRYYFEFEIEAETGDTIWQSIEI